jgi:hypothetical protein
MLTRLQAEVRVLAVYLRQNVQTGCGAHLVFCLMASGFLSRSGKRPKSEFDHPSLLSAEVKNAWSYTSTPKLT